MGMTEFVQLWRKLYILVQIPLLMNLSPNYSVPKLYSCFLWLYSFLRILIWGRQNFYSYGKSLHFGTNTIVNEFKTKAQCIKTVQLFPFIVELCNHCKAFQRYMLRRKFVQLWKKWYILVQMPLKMNLSPNHSVLKLYSCFLWLYSFLKILIWGLQNLYSFRENCTFCCKYHCK